uniref:Prolactin regulatory element-binding protein n=1 Tax=Macaca fascicularis TaxID=9541 RepID=A0A2K5W7Q0_MACFA
MGPCRAPELYRAPFPLLGLQVDPSTGLLIAAGGGGAAKAGIKNGVHFLQLERINGRLSASLLHSHDTETRVTMNLALAGDILAAGQDAHCQLLRFQAHQQKVNKAEKAGSKKQGPRQRKGAHEGLELRVENLQAVQTDFSSDPLQKVVCFNHDNTLLATGGTDGYVRVWKVPGLEKVLEFKAHEGEFEDLALGPDLVTQLHWQENGPTVSSTPYHRQACSESGTFLGLGMVTGSVAIYIAFSLQCLYYMREAHGIVVTDVAFLPEKGRGPELLGSHETARFSVAVDSHCQLHLLPSLQSVPVRLLLLLCVGLIVVTILLLQSVFPGFL